MNSQRISAITYTDLPPQKTTIDLRTAAEREHESIVSISLPLQELDATRFQTALNNANYDTGPVYLLCQSGRRADMAVDKLTGLTDVPLVIIEGGLNALKSAGYPTIQGQSKTISLERQVRITAGALTLLGVVLGTFVHSGFYGLSGFIGAGLVFAGVTDTCGMGMALARMPWNQISPAAGAPIKS